MSNGPVTNPPKKRGCLFYGCLSVAIIAVVFVLMLGIGLYIAKRTLTKLVDGYTGATPQTIEQVTYPPPEREALQSRLAAFTDAVNKREGGKELVLTATDLNVLIGENLDWKGRLFVTFDNDQVKAKVAIPLDSIGIEKLRGRYLNGTGALRVALEGGQLDVRLESIEVGGKPLPAAILGQLKKNNLAEGVNRDPKQAQEFGKYDSLQIKDGKVILKSKAGQ